MIYILEGNDLKKKSTRLLALVGPRNTIQLREEDSKRESLLEYAESISLFGDSPIVVIKDVLSEKSFSLSAKDLTFLESSQTLFIFLEDTLKAADKKKYEKYASIESMNTQKIAKAPTVNTFAIADSFARRDKIGTWVLYHEAINTGALPEMISGMLFWKIKTLILGTSTVFTKEELKKQSSSIVSLYHQAHRGEKDFIIGLEQFILSSLSK